MKSKKQNSWYTEDFKQRAIALAEEIGVVSAAPKLGVNPNTLESWLWRRANRPRMSKKKDTPDARAAAEAQREIERLKRENEELKKANWVLKEVASFFSKDRSNSNLKRSFTSPKKDKKQ